MIENLIPYLALLLPLLFSLIALASWFQFGARPKFIIRMSKVVTLTAILLVALMSFYTEKLGLIESPLLGIDDFGLSIRLDSLSMVMLGMISLLSFIIFKFSFNYLDGDSHQGAFLGRLAATIASVQLLVLSGNLGLLFISWMLTSVSLHRLLIFYRERPGAQIAAKKKFILARLADVSLLLAITILYREYGTGNLEDLFIAMRIATESGTFSNSLEISALFLVLAALFKSAQFPTHGWLIEVMETPTPVSALLHAGLLNAGPFLIIRMAFVMEASSIAPLVLMLIGGFTALFASVVYLTQTSVKTALAYSSIGHMGFSLMLCGLGAFPAAMLHMVAHSFYKAHSFLSSGSVIDVLRGSKVTALPQKVSIFTISAGLFLALLVYTGFGLLWGLDLEKDFSLVLIGCIIVMGLARLFSSAIARNWNGKLLLQATFMALAVTLAFFSLEAGTHYILGIQVPHHFETGIGKMVLSGIILLTFSAAVFVQMWAPQMKSKASYQQLAIHLKNGLYANAYFDKLINALHLPSYKNQELLKPGTSQSVPQERRKVKEMNEQWA